MGLWFETAGDGAPIVFIHAAVGDSRMWEPQWSHFAKSNQVIRCDMVGFGQSPWTPGPYSQAGSVLAVLDGVGVDHAVIIGASMGGRVATEIAVARTQLVDGLVLVGSAMIGHNWSAEVQRYDEAENAAIAAGDIDAAVELNLSFWLDGPNRDRSAVSEPTRDLVAAMQRLAFEHQVPAMDDDEEQLLVEDLRDRLSSIECPTLVMVGDEDAADIIDIADWLSMTIPNSTRLTIPGAAHLPSLEKPEEFNTALAQFLTTL